MQMKSHFGFLLNIFSLKEAPNNCSIMLYYSRNIIIQDTNIIEIFFILVIWS